MTPLLEQRAQVIAGLAKAVRGDKGNGLMSPAANLTETARAKRLKFCSFTRFASAPVLQGSLGDDVSLWAQRLTSDDFPEESCASRSHRV